MNILAIATTDKLALNVMRCLHRSGETVFLMGPDSLIGARVSRYRRSTLNVDKQLFVAPHFGAAEIINRFCAQYQIEMIIGVDLDGILMIAAIQDQIKDVRIFPVAPVPTLEQLHDKWSFYSLLTRHHLPTPKTFLVNDTRQLSDLPLSYPVIAKPPDLENGIGVCKLASAAEAQSYLKSIGQFPILFQEYIPGVDIDLSLLADHGQVTAWAIQKWLPNGSLTFLENPAILEIGQRIVAATAFHGVAHFDMRLDERDGSLKVLECNPRFWASLRESMWNGTNFVQQGICLAAGVTPLQSINRQITYIAPGRVLRAILKGDFSVFGRLSIKSLKDAWQTIADPLTLICQIRQKLKRQGRNPR